MKKTLCAILCYNNKKTILKVVKEKKKLKNICDVVFINDGSTDNTNKILDNKKLIVINHKKNLGYGLAVKSAFKYAKNNKYSYLAIFPADNQRYVEDLVSMINSIQNFSYDLVLGSKYKILKKIPLHRKIGNVFFSLFAKIIWNCQLKDVLSGFKIYKINSFYKYLGDLPNDYSFDLVLTQLMNLNNMKFKELDVKCRYNNNTSSMKGVFKFDKKNIFFVGLKMIFDALIFFINHNHTKN